MRVCEECESIEESCCAASKARRETAISLAKIVTRQSEQIQMLAVEVMDLKIKLGGKDAVIEGLRAEIKDWVGASV